MISLNAELCYVRWTWSQSTEFLEKIPPCLGFGKNKGGFFQKSHTSTTKNSCRSLENLIFERFRAFELEIFLPSAVIFEKNHPLVLDLAETTGDFFQRGDFFKGTRLISVLLLHTPFITSKISHIIMKKPE